MTSQESTDHESLNLLSQDTMQQLCADLQAEDCKPVFDDPALFAEYPAANNESALTEFSRERPPPPNPWLLVPSSEHQCSMAVPTLTEFDGVFGFCLDIGKQPKLSKSTVWCYASDMNRLYVKPHKQCQLAFTLKRTASANTQDRSLCRRQYSGQQLYIRATAVYTHQLQVPVERCANHLLEDSAYEHCRHFVWSDHPLTTYSCDAGSSLSTVVPYQCSCEEIAWRSKDAGVPEASGPCRTVWYGYSFKCLSSCSGSLNRRPVSVIFALETSTGEVLGRRVVELKVCTCPGRDMVRDRKSVLQPVGARQQRRQVASRANEQCVRRSNVKHGAVVHGPSLTVMGQGNQDQPKKLRTKPPLTPQEVSASSVQPLPAPARFVAGGGCDAAAVASVSQAVDDNLYCVQVRGRERFQQLQRIANLMNSAAANSAFEQSQLQYQQQQPHSNRHSVTARIDQSHITGGDAGNSLSTDSVHSDSDSKHSSQPIDDRSSQPMSPAAVWSRASAKAMQIEETKSTTLTSSLRQAPSVQKWLESLGLAPYTDDFVRAGYRTMADLEDVQTFGAKDLQKLRIGAAHASVIWKSLKQWRMQV